MTFGGFKHLTRRTAFDKILRDKAFMDINGFDGYEWDLASIIHKFFDKKTLYSNKEIGEELHKIIIRNFKKIKVHSSFIDNIWVLILLICNK